MTWGHEYAWKDVMDRSTSAVRRERTSAASFIAGNPVPFMDAGEDEWA